METYYQRGKIIRDDDSVQGGSRMNISSIVESLDELKARFKAVPARDYVVERDKSKRAMFLTPYTSEQLENMGAKTYLTDDGVGLALTPDGDMIGIFNNSGRSGGGVEAVILGIAEGAKTLDCIGSHLENYYKRFGFVEKERAVWDDEQAPVGWDYDIGGSPDVIFFEYPENLSREPADVAERFRLVGGGRTTGGAVFPGGNSLVDTGTSESLRDRISLGEPKTSPGPTGTASDILENKETTSRPGEGGFFSGQGTI
ncbi:MAG: hypothetical protein LBG29_00750 [Synergistaceae bacterium]|nr:hypothetical protein [Synergistaceae bacterium]